MLKSLQKRLSLDKKATLLIIAGSLAWSATMVKSGLRYGYGVGFWGPNGHDGVWHISLIRSLSEGSFEMPIYAGETLKNYHIGFDLLLALVHKLTNIPIPTLYFQVFPPLAALLIGILVYRLVLNWKKSTSAACWSTFFVYFAGNLGWIVTLIRNGDIGGESIFWAQPSMLTLINPPFALSLVFILVGLNLLVKINKASTGKYLLLVLLFGLLIQVKAYAGVIVLGALFTSGLYEFWKERKLTYFKIFIASALISFVVFLPNLGSGSLLQFNPFWFLETMMSFPDRLGWVRFGEAMVNYRAAGNWLRAIPAYVIAIVIFWYGNLGARFMNEFYWVKLIKSKKKISSFDNFLGSAIAIGFMCTLLFVQKGTAWNTIQFFYYSLFFTSILSGVVFAGILDSKYTKRYKNLLIVGILVLTLPTTVSILRHYLPSRPPSMIPNYELEALWFLGNQQKGTVLVLPFDRKTAGEAVDNPPRPLRLYESTSYVSAYSGQQVWMEDEVNLDITSYNWQERREKLSKIIEENNQDRMRQFLDEENISYVYAVGEKNNVFSGLENIYGESDLNIYKTAR